MTRIIWESLVLLVFLVTLAVADDSLTVDCGKGQSLNVALAKLNKYSPITVLVTGTCSEYVHVTDFDGLVLKGQPGAKLQQPTSSPGNLVNAVLYIQSSRSVTIDGLTIQAPTTGVPPIAIGQGSRDIRLRNLNVIGGVYGIIVFENSQVSIAYVTAQDPGYATLGAYDLSDIHVEHSSFTNTTGAQWHVGLDIGSASHVAMFATTITNMQQGINANRGSMIEMEASNAYYNTGDSTDVTINNPAGTNFNGVTVGTGASLTMGNAKLVINQAGQTWGGTTGGILLTDNAALNAGTGLLAITGSNGQGIVALNNSHATINGVRVTGSTHGGLLAANLSSIDVAAGPSQTLVGGNSVDLFCDAGSMITGAVNLAGTPTSSCANLLSSEMPNLP